MASFETGYCDWHCETENDKPRSLFGVVYWFNGRSVWCCVGQTEGRDCDAQRQK